MNLLGIKNKAEAENLGATKAWVDYVLKNLTGAESFSTGDVPSSLIEEYCDKHGIPCHEVCYGYVSLAPTYTKLLKYEEER